MEPVDLLWLLPLGFIVYLGLNTFLLIIKVALMMSIDPSGKLFKNKEEKQNERKRNKQTNY